MTTRTFIVRPCFQQDLTFVQLIYAHAVITGTGTFETEPPDLEEMTARWSKVVARGWPFLVASDAQDVSRIYGFAYAQQFRDRQAYAKTFEDSVYVSHLARGMKIGTALMHGLLGELQAIGAEQVIAVIGDSANAGSIKLHESCGFRHAGRLVGVGHKFGRVLDVVMMQASIRSGS
ncbi:MAG: GNAT family N-acetyltransferase [Alphaproteobacteria bacterium]|nr:GNAT family N-acetyltransferase [Alphaproteobacteria bacterium]